jgi:hypothetical protein
MRNSLLNTDGLGTPMLLKIICRLLQAIEPPCTNYFKTQFKVLQKTVRDNIEEAEEVENDIVKFMNVMQHFRTLHRDFGDEARTRHNQRIHQSTRRGSLNVQVCESTD